MSDFLSMSDEDFLNATEPAIQDTTPLPVPEESQHKVGFDETPQTYNEQPTEHVEQPEPESLDQLYQPFKANGRDFQVRNLDEARKLMQMGANYTQKMQQLAPNLRYVKTLEREGLLSDEKLNYLIDLSKNNPQAIAKLVKDSEIDTYNLDSEQEYTPQNYQMSESSIQLDSVLDSIEHTPTYARCIDVVGNQWDLQSRQELATNPDLIVQINNQMQSGIYDKIATEVDRMRVFGAFQGMTDFQAYRQVGAEMHQRGLLENTSQPTQPQRPVPVARTVPQQPQQQVIAQRAAAASPNEMRHRNSPPPPRQSLLAMSDEEFLRLYSSR